MKTYVLFVCFTISFGVTSYCQPVWKPVVPLPTNKSLQAISFINDNQGWLAGSSNTLLKTANRGGIFSAESVLAGQDWNGVQFISAQKGWVCSSGALIEMTANGGGSWTVQAPASTLAFAAMQFIDDMHGFVLLEYDSLLYTTNGGAVWNRLNIDPVEYHYGINFVSTTEGWLCGSNGFIQHTTNGGLTWTTQSTGVSQDLYSIYFLNNLEGWAAGYSNTTGVVLHTTDGGSTWNTIVNDYAYKFLKLFFKDALNGFAIDGSSVYKTSNGGVNWTSIFTSPGEALNDFQFTSSANLYVCGSVGAIYNSADNGTTWTPLYKTATHEADIRAMSFPDQKHGWVLPSGLLYTSDSGNTWVDRTPPYNNFEAGAIDFVDSLRGWVAGKWPATGYGQILRTTNGGLNYNFQLNTANYPFISVNFLDSLHGLAGTNNKTIYYTSNGGARWDSASIPSNVSFLKVIKMQMVDSIHAYAIASNVYNTVLAKTSDGGQSWDTIKTNEVEFTPAYTDVHFIDAQHGYVSVFTFNGSPNKSSLIATNDGGRTWDTINYPPGLSTDISQGQVNKIYFSDMMHGWAAGGGFNSFILHTDNGGTSWSTQEFGSNVAWYDMQFIDPQTAYVAGWQGNIARMNVNIILPVTWLNFDGILNNEKAVLTWSTANENNNKGYEVQRSLDGQTFAAIGFVAGTGNSSYIHTYKFDDAKLLGGSNYYRLKQIDLDGKFNFSSIIKLDFTKFNWLISDNPVTSNSWVQVELDKTAIVSIRIISTAGNIIKTIIKGKTTPGTYSIPLGLSNAAKGVYVIELLVDDKVFTKKFIK